MLEWAFGLPVSISKLQDTTATLSALQQTVAKNSAFTLNFSVQGTNVSQQALQAATCSVSDLLADARSQAQKLANVSGLTLGSVLAMSSSTNAQVQADILGGLSIGRFYTSTSASSAPLCALTVKFSVTRF